MNKHSKHESTLKPFIVTREFSVYMNRGARVSDACILNKGSSSTFLEVQGNKKHKKNTGEHNGLNVDKVETNNMYPG